MHKVQFTLTKSASQTDGNIIKVDYYILLAGDAYPSLVDIDQGSPTSIYSVNSLKSSFGCVGPQEV